MFVPDNIKHKVNLEMALKLNLNEKKLGNDDYIIFSRN